MLLQCDCYWYLTRMMLAMAKSPQWLMLVSQPVIPRRSAIC
jgi:hypothetical protein